MKVSASILSACALMVLLVCACGLPTAQAQTDERSLGLPGLPTSQPSPQTASGKYYALVIGNNNYVNLTRLKTAVADAEAVAALLRLRYGFETRLLLNANRQKILAAVAEYRRSLEPSANLIIYYAGHGTRDTDVDKAYWLPVDASLEDNANWISADDITTNIKGMPARHVLIISDSCYSGAIYRDLGGDLLPPTGRERVIQRMLLGKSRKLMTSGGVEPVLDSGGGGHSVFANALLKGLSQMEPEVFSAEEMFVAYVREGVAGRSNQLPEYSPLFNSGHEGGDFVFMRKPVVVPQVPNLTLTLRRAVVAAAPGQQVQLPVTITNTGNQPDQFRVETDLPAEYGPKFTSGQNALDTGLPVLDTPLLARGQSVDLMLNVRVPEAARDAQQHRFFVRAVSKSDKQISKVADGSLTVVAAALAGAATVSRDTVQPGETFMQTITVKNQGSAPAKIARTDFVFNPNFELVQADPAPITYDRDARTAIWSLGDLAARESREIKVTVRATADALAVTGPLGRGTSRTSSLTAETSYTGPVISIGRVSKVNVEAGEAALNAKPGDILYLPFIVRNAGNYAEAYKLHVTPPDAAGATLFADTNGDGRHQESEPALTQTPPLAPRTGQFPLLLRVNVPRSIPDRINLVYSIAAQPLSPGQDGSEITTTLTIEHKRGAPGPMRPSADETAPAQPTTHAPPESNLGDAPPDAEQALFSKGQRLYNQQQYEQAAGVFNDFLKTYPRSIITDLTLMWLGRSYIALGRLPEAEQIAPRIRAVKDTPFVDIYEGELKQARTDAAARTAKPQSGASLRHVSDLTANDAPRGAQVTITSDVPLNDYSAYRSGDRFYVVMPRAAMSNVKPALQGKGFSDVQVQRRGEDVVLSFKLNAGVSAHINQKFNRLVVQFSVSDK